MKYTMKARVICCSSKFSIIFSGLELLLTLLKYNVYIQCNSVILIRPQFSLVRTEKPTNLFICGNTCVNIFTNVHICIVYLCILY